MECSLDFANPPPTRTLTFNYGDSRKLVMLLFLSGGVQLFTGSVSGHYWLLPLRIGVRLNLVQVYGVGAQTSARGDFGVAGR
jgi:hypothetical protein